MAKRPQKSRPAEPPPALSPAWRSAARSATAERKLRILERLTTGVSIGYMARVEHIAVRRPRQIIAEMLAQREVYQLVGFVQLQIARLSDAMIVAHTRMREGDLKAMDRLINLVGELDRYHGFGRVQIAAARRSPARWRRRRRPSAPPQRASFSRRGRRPRTPRRKFSAPQALERPRNAAGIGPGRYSVERSIARSASAIVSGRPTCSHRPSRRTPNRRPSSAAWKNNGARGKTSSATPANNCGLATPTPV